MDREEEHPAVCERCPYCGEWMEEMGSYNDDGSPMGQCPLCQAEELMLFGRPIRLED